MYYFLQQNFFLLEKHVENLFLFYIDNFWRKFKLYYNAHQRTKKLSSQFLNDLFIEKIR
jgi:hypothetical protein